MILYFVIVLSEISWVGRKILEWPINYKIKKIKNTACEGMKQTEKAYVGDC